MDELRRRARGRASEVSGLDERDGKTRSSGMRGDSRADDPASDDEQVEAALGELVEGLGTRAHRRSVRLIGLAQHARLGTCPRPRRGLPARVLEHPPRAGAGHRGGDGGRARRRRRRVRPGRCPRLGSGARGVAVPRRDLAPPAHVLRAADHRVPASGAVVRVPDRARLGAGARLARRRSCCWERRRRLRRSAECCSSRCGVLLVRGIRGPAALGDLALALAIGVCIAAYTLLDQRGVEYASPIVYQELSMIPVAIVFLVYVLARRGAIRR